MLGEFVLPACRPLWTAALVRALAEVGVEEKAARQALARTAASGILTRERDGRRVAWRLTAAGRGLLTDGARRIYGFTAGMAQWDGRWLILTVSVPERQRALRHRLRTRLTWAGLGTPAPGLWIGPDPAKEAEVARAVADLGLDAVSFIGRSSGDLRRMVRDAWNLDDVARRYRAFVARFRRGSGPPFANQVHLVHEWRRFPFLDPSLPHELLPARWPGTRAAELFHRRHDGWHAAAQAHWRDLAI